METNFTIVIPHKNTPTLLERLVDSIPPRDDLEIIVVDDHSDADVVDFNHFPCKDRAGLAVVMNKECHGAGYARNCALPLAKGRWILFADSDDFFNSGFNEFLNRGAAIVRILLQQNHIEATLWRLYDFFFFLDVAINDARHCGFAEFLCHIICYFTIFLAFLRA